MPPSVPSVHDGFGAGASGGGRRQSLDPVVSPLHAVAFARGSHEPANDGLQSPRTFPERMQAVVASAVVRGQGAVRRSASVTLLCGNVNQGERCM